MHTVFVTQTEYLSRREETNRRAYICYMLVENCRVKITAIHAETMHPRMNPLSTSPLTYDSQLVLKITDALTLHHIFRQSIVDIDIAKDRSIEEISVTSH